MLGWPAHGNFAHTARREEDNQRRDLNERDWDLFVFLLLSPPADCCMRCVPRRLKVFHVICTFRLSGGQIHHPSREQQMSKKRKSPDDQDFEESPRAGCSDQGRSNGQKWRGESWTAGLSLQSPDAPKLGWYLQGAQSTQPLQWHVTDWRSTLHSCISIFDPWKTILFDRCWLLFIISPSRVTFVWH